jgi:hypothetical protein
MTGGLSTNRASLRQVKKRTIRKWRISGQFSSREDREAFRETRGSVSPARKPFAIAEEFGDARIQDPDCFEISGLAARPGEETSTGCGLARSRTGNARVLRRTRSLTYKTTFQGAVDKKTARRLVAASSRRCRLSFVRAGSACRATGASCRPRNCQVRHDPCQVTPMRL